MSLKRRSLAHVILTLAVLPLITPTVLAADVFNMPVGQTSLQSVPVRNAGNSPDPTTGGLYGAVAYNYHLGKYEVTAGQYTEFLNAVARTDTYGLYNPSMADPLYAPPSYVTGCNIQRSGAPGNYSYSVPADYANRPVNYVSWGDSARFANWLNNGQPSGMQDATTTEDGAYHINGAMTDAALLAVVRRTSATWVIPTRDEWYKGAYHKNNGVTGNYWRYPTSSDSIPGVDVSETTQPGNNANYAHALGNSVYVTSLVGQFQLSDSAYGTFDQAGNVAEWTEAIYQSSRRIAYGGSWAEGAVILASSPGGFVPTPSSELANLGFRLALVPEPATLPLFGLAALAIFHRSSRRRV